MLSIESGSDDADPSSVTVNGTLPLFGLTLRFAVGAPFGRRRFPSRKPYPAEPVVSGIVSFVPPVPGTSEGAVARTLANVPLIAWPPARGDKSPPEQKERDRR